MPETVAVRLLLRLSCPQWWHGELDALSSYPETPCPEPSCENCMLFIGTMNWASTRLKGMFLCPNCNATEQFRLRASRPFLTLYFIPVIPIGGLQEFVQCQKCKNAFEPLILSNRMMPANMVGESKSSTQKEAPTFERDLLFVIALMMVEDGHVTEEEIRVARRLYENITETNISREELGNACSMVRLQRLTTLSFLATASKRRGHEEKLLLIQAMFGIAGADGEITAGRMESLVQSKNLLELDTAEFERAINQTNQWLA